MNTINNEVNNATPANAAVASESEFNRPASYSFVEYDSAHAPVPSTGNRVSKCLYRSDSKEGHANSYIELLALTEADITEHLTVLMPHFVSYCESVQDDIIKALHKSKFTAVDASSISMDAVIDKLESAGEGRLNKDQVFSWFDAEMADTLLVAFADKLGVTDTPTEAEQEKLDLILATYRTKYGALAGGKSKFMPEEAEKLQQAIVVAEADQSSLGARFVARLVKMQEPEEDLLLSL